MLAGRRVVAEVPCSVVEVVDLLLLAAGASADVGPNVTMPSNLSALALPKPFTFSRSAMLL
jgi:hypothetical protein